MRKGTRKRGRPGIRPHIVRLIASRILEEQAKPPEARLPTKVLAYEIHKQISQTGDRPPEVSTLEKKISKTRADISSKPDLRDKPWTIHSMVEYPIAAEALPSVLQVWFLVQDNDGSLSIRDAQWVARLYAAIKDIEYLCSYSMMMSLTEKLADVAGIEDFMGSRIANLHVFSIMTGHIITREEEERVSGLSTETWRQAEELWPNSHEQVKAIVPEGLRPPALGIHYEKEAISEEREPSRKEAKYNERKHKAKR